VLGIRGSAKHARVGTTTKQIALLVHIVHLVLFNKKKSKGIALRVFDIRTKMKWVILNAKPVKTGNTNLTRVARRATSGTVAMAAVTTHWWPTWRTKKPIANNPTMAVHARLCVKVGINQVVLRPAV
jgi:hypothetical protein